jgi:hypothetical protein
MGPTKIDGGDTEIPESPKTIRLLSILIKYNLPIEVSS